MNGSGALAFEVDHRSVRLAPSSAASLAPGPGRLGRGGVAGAILFDVGAPIWSMDLFEAFWREEAVHLEWMRDFLCDPDMNAFFERLADPEEEEEEEEILYSKSYLTTLGSEVMDDV